MANSISVEGVHAAYGAVRVLEDVTLKVDGGETVVLLGTNGNGKSTLMKSIMGMVRPSAGRIMAEIDGITHDLIGRSTEENYFVICDQRLNDVEQVAAGRFQLLFGFATSRPADFQAFLVTHEHGGSSVRAVSVNRYALPPQR